MQFRQVSKKQQEIADAVGVNPTDKCLRLSGNLDTCPKNQKLAALFEEAIGGFRQVSEIAKDRRTRTREEAMIKSYTDLDKCPKPVKIAALFEDDYRGRERER